MRRFNHNLRYSTGHANYRSLLFLISNYFLSCFLFKVTFLCFSLNLFNSFCSSNQTSPYTNQCYDMKHPITGQIKYEINNITSLMHVKTFTPNSKLNIYIPKAYTWTRQLSGLPFKGHRTQEL